MRNPELTRSNHAKGFVPLLHVNVFRQYGGVVPSLPAITTTLTLQAELLSRVVRSPIKALVIWSRVPETTLPLETTLARVFLIP